MTERYYSTNIPFFGERTNSNLDPGFQRALNQNTDLILKRALLLETGHGELRVDQALAPLKAQILDVFLVALKGVNSESDEGKRVRTVVRPVLESFLQGTLLRSIHHDSYLNLLYTSILLARDPSLFSELTISTGFGGSSDADTNIRVPSYIIPGLKILENLRVFRQKDIIDFELPKFRIFFAPYSAVAVNGTEMSLENVLRNLNQTREYILKYIDFFHRDISQNVYFEVENPWDQHDSVTKAVLNYFSQFLINSQDEHIKKSLSILRERGIKHGGEHGAELAHVYAAMHPLLFKDAVNHPRVNIFADGGKSVFALSIGGRPERLFNRVRSYIRKSVEFPSLLTSMTQERVTSSQTDTDSGQDSKLLNTDIFPVQPDYLSSPITSTLAITEVGSTPAYYRTKYDLGIRTYSDSPLAYLASMKEAISRQLSGTERALELKRLDEIERDMRAIVDDVGGEEILMTFLDSFNS